MNLCAPDQFITFKISTDQALQIKFSGGESEVRSQQMGKWPTQTQLDDGYNARCNFGQWLGLLWNRD